MASEACARASGGMPCADARTAANQPRPSARKTGGRPLATAAGTQMRSHTAWPRRVLPQVRIEEPTQRHLRDLEASRRRPPPGTGNPFVLCLHRETPDPQKLRRPAAALRMASTATVATLLLLLGAGLCSAFLLPSKCSDAVRLSQTRLAQCTAPSLAQRRGGAPLRMGGFGAGFGKATNKPKGGGGKKKSGGKAGGRKASTPVSRAPAAATGMKQQVASIDVNKV